MTRRKTHEEFVIEVFELVGVEYEIIGEYINSKTKVKMRHNNESCGHYEFETISNVFLRGSRCPKCAGNIKKSHNEFVQEIFNLVGNEYSVLGNYINTKTKLEMKHNICGHTYPVAPQKFLIGRRCPKCSHHIKKDTDYFRQELFNLVGDEYDIISDYIRDDIHVTMKHNGCGYEYSVTPTNFLRGRRCPKCSKRNSKGERRIIKFLDKNKILNKSQYWFEDCKDENVLRFDSAVFNKDNELVLLIEFDGDGHFVPFRFSKNKEKMLKKLKDTQRRDVIKNRYCIDNDIPLIRIPNWEYFNIEYILENTLKYFEVIYSKDNTYDTEIVKKYLVDSNWSQEKYINKYKRLDY